MCDTELYQMLLALTPPLEVSAVDLASSSSDRPLGEIAITVQWRPVAPLSCSNCGVVAPGYDSCPRCRRHLNTMQRNSSSPLFLALTRMNPLLLT